MAIREWYEVVVRQTRMDREGGDLPAYRLAGRIFDWTQAVYFYRHAAGGNAAGRPCVDSPRGVRWAGA